MSDDTTHGICNVTDDNYISGRDRCPATSTFSSMMGVAISISLACLGSAYGTAKSGVGVVSAGVMTANPEMKNSLPVILAGILGIYGLITGVAIITTVKENIPLYLAYAHLAAGISTGVSTLAAGISIGIAGNASVRAVVRSPRLFVVMLLILVFGEALALFGLIISLILALTSSEDCPELCLEYYGTVTN